MSVSKFGLWTCLAIAVSLLGMNAAWSQNQALDDVAPAANDPTANDATSSSSAVAATNEVPVWVVFSGNEHFSSEQLETALMGEADYLLARHPMSARYAIHQIVDKLLTDGYRNEGFGDVEVLVTDGPAAGSIECQITEGPRYVGGAVVIEGAEKIDQTRLIARLTTPYPKSECIPQIHENGQGIRTTWVDSDGKPADLQDPVFEIGEPVSFDREDSLRKSVEQALKDLGYSRSFPLVRLDKDRDAAKLNLVISIADEGTPNVIKDVSVTGAGRHGPLRVIEFLGLKAGQTLDRKLEVMIHQKLWQSGRFSKHSVVFEPASGTVRIELEEVPGVPLLDEPLDEFAMVMLRTRKWLLFCDENQIDTSMEWGVSDTEGVRLIVSSEGAFAQMTVSGEDTELPGEKLSLLADANDFVIEQSSQPDVYRIESAIVGGQLSFQTMFGPAEEDDKVITNRFTFNATTNREDDEAAVKHQWTVSPAQMLGIAYKSKLKREISGGVLSLSCTDEELDLQIDVATGAIKTWEMDNGRLRFGRGLLDQARTAFLKRVAAKPNSMDPNRAVSTLISYAISEGMLRQIQSIYAISDKPFEMPDAVAMSGIRKLVDSGLLTIPDAILVKLWENDEPEDTFNIPMQDPKRSDFQSMMIEVAASLILRNAPKYLPEQGWPMKVTREACLVAMGRGQYAGKVLQELIQDDANGPLCHAAVAYLLSLIGQETQKSFAARGLMAMTPELFAKDYAQLGPLMKNDLVMKTLASFQPLSRQELAAVLSMVKNENVRNLLDLAARHPLDQQRDQSDFWFSISQTKLTPWLESMSR